MAKPFYIYPRSGRRGFYAELNIGGERKRVKAGETREEAERSATAAATLRDMGHDLDSILEAVFPKQHKAARPKSERLTFRQAAIRYLETAERRLGDSTYRKRRRMLTRIGKAAWTSKRIAAVTPPMLNGWAESRRESGAGPCAVNRDLNAIACVFKWAESVGIVEHNPARSAQVRRDKEPRRDMWFTAEELEYLFGVADKHAPDFAPVLRLLFWTGARRGELAQFEWRDVDLNSRMVTVRAEVAKGGTERQFELTPDAHQLLRSLPSRFKGGLVLLRSDGGPFSDGVYRDRVDILRGRAVGDELPAHKRGSSIRLHALRHSHITLLAAAGVPLTLIGQAVGQSSQWMTERYAHVTPQGLHAVATAGADVFKPRNQIRAAK
ncbi:MAG: site-specific integrase [Planctomycetota bacterium]